jgi:hypothetical protein
MTREFNNVNILKYLVRFAEQGSQDVDKDTSFNDSAAHRDSTNVETTTESASIVLVQSRSDLAEPLFSSPTHILSPDDEERSLTPALRTTTPRSYSLDQPQALWPLPREDEAFLLQYFTTELAKWV